MKQSLNQSYNNLSAGIKVIWNHEFYIVYSKTGREYTELARFEDKDEATEFYRDLVTDIMREP